MSGACPRGCYTVSECFRFTVPTRVSARRRCESREASREAAAPLSDASPRVDASAPRRDRNCPHSVTRSLCELRSQRDRESSNTSPTYALDPTGLQPQQLETPLAVSPARSAARISTSHAPAMAATAHSAKMAYPMLNETGPRAQHFRGLTLGPSLIPSDLPHFGLTAC